MESNSDVFRCKGATLIHGDCVEGMKAYPDGYFDLALVDAPYGGGCTFGTVATGDAIERRGGGWTKKYTPKGKPNGEEDIRNWDIAPGAEYFNELFRVSRNQIIFGGNYYNLPPSRCYVVWRKTNIPKTGFSMSPTEFIWTSFNRNAMMVECSSFRKNRKREHHYAEKPVELYEWLLRNFAERGQRILDTHVGSGNSLVACNHAGLESVGFEIAKGFWDMAASRLEEDNRVVSFFEESESFWA